MVTVPILKKWRLSLLKAALLKYRPFPPSGRGWDTMVPDLFPGSWIMAKHSHGFLMLVDDAKKRVTECTVADVKRKLERGEKFQLVDVREESEWAAGHLPKAMH